MPGIGNSPLGQDVGGVQTWFARDGLGSVRALFNSSAAQVRLTNFDPYGTPLESSGSASTHLGYTGALTDETGLVYLHARYYAPVSGQFLSGDPIEGRVGDARSWNRYGYVGGNPGNWTDPSGKKLKCLECGSGEGGGYGGPESAGLGVGLPTTTNFPLVSPSAIPTVTPGPLLGVIRDALDIFVAANTADAKSWEGYGSREEALDALSKDPDRGGVVDETSREEAEVILDAVERGIIKPPVRRPPGPGQGDFIDGDGKAWDIKGFRSRESFAEQFAKDPTKPVRGEFDVDAAIRNIKNTIGKQRDILLDTRKLTESDLRTLKDAVVKEDLTGKITYYP